MPKKGRPTKFEDIDHGYIHYLYEVKGMTDVQVAEKIGVTERTLNNWKNKYPDFFQSLKDWKKNADEVIEATLFNKAAGKIVLTEIHEGVDANGNIVDKKIVKETPPDTTSMIFWLKNRQPEKWRDKKEVAATVEGVEEILKKARLKDDVYKKDN